LIRQVKVKFFTRLKT